MPILLLLLVLSALSWAHPFGADLYGHKTELRLGRDQVQVDYLAEISTVDHLRDMRTWLSGQPDHGPQAEARYIALVLEELHTGLDLYVDGQRVPLVSQPVEEDSGKGDSRFVTFRLRLVAPLPADSSQLNLVNGNLPTRPGLFSTALFVDDAVVVDACSLFEVQEGALARDRTERWLADEDQRELRVAFHVRSAAGEGIQRGFRRLAAGGPVDSYTPASTRLSTVEHDPLQDLIRGELTPVAVVLGLLTAVVLGVLHGLSPGHGKALVAAYLVGSRRSPMQAVWLGLIVTITHTASVYVLGLVALVLAESFSAEAVLPWLELVSGLLVLGVGATLIRSRLRARTAATRSDDGHHHQHAHGHAHAHQHSGDDAAHGAAHAQEFVAAGEGWRGLVALGISGGLAPCPSALVLLLTAIGLQRIGLGLVLVAAFSVGLAVLVTGLGIAVVLLGDRLRRSGPARGAVGLLPVLSAVVVTVLGAGLTWRGVQAVLVAIG